MIENLRDRAIQTHTLLLIRSWLEDHDQAIRREFRSGKQYQKFMYDFITLMITDSSALHRLQEGQLEIWLKSNGTLSVGRGAGLHRNDYSPPLEGQLSLVDGNERP